MWGGDCLVVVVVGGCGGMMMPGWVWGGMALALRAPLVLVGPGGVGGWAWARWVLVYGCAGQCSALRRQSRAVAGSWPAHGISCLGAGRGRGGSLDHPLNPQQLRMIQAVRLPESLAH